MHSYSDPRQVIITVLRWWWLILLVILIAAVTGHSVTQNQTPVYEATATVMVGGFIQSPQINRDDLVARDAFTQAYAEMALRQPVLAGVVEALGLPVSWKQVKDVVGVEVVANTPLIEIYAEASSPEEAQAIAGEIANQLILLSQAQGDEGATRQFVQQEIQDLQARIDNGRERLADLQRQVTYPGSPERLDELKMEIDSLERIVTDWEDTYSRLLTVLQSNTSQNSLTIIEEAQANSKPVYPRPELNMFLSASVGLGVALALVFLIDLFDDRIRTTEDLTPQLGLNLLGTITKMKGKQYDGKLITAQSPLQGTAFFYKKILDNIGFVKKGNARVRSLLVTSPRLREGKSVTVSNLAIMVAQAGLRTVILDVDWKKPTQHLLFDIKNDTGLMDLLRTEELITAEQLRTTSVQNLQVLTVGSLADDPIEILQPKRMKEILADLTKVSDVVILDAPSTAYTESAILFGLVDGVVLVIDSGRTTMASVKRSMASLQLTGGKLLGGILNRSSSPWSIS